MGLNLAWCSICCSVRATFKTHILNAATGMLSLEWKFRLCDLAPLTASSIMLEVYRTECMQVKKRIAEYEPFCIEAVLSFYRNHEPCGFRDPLYRGPCINVYTKHTKGYHIRGKHLIAVGEYIHRDVVAQSCVELVGGRQFFRQYIEKDFKEIKIEQTQHTDIETSRQIDKDCQTNYWKMAIQHQRSILGQYTTLWNWKLARSHLPEHHTCFACLFATPTHTLNCSHVVCDLCVRDFATPSSGTNPKIQNCPLCGNFEESLHNPNRTRTSQIRMDAPKPRPRILTLDG